MRITKSLVVVSTLWLVGCGSTPADGTDAGTTVDASDEIDASERRDAARPVDAFVRGDIGPIDYPDAGWEGADPLVLEPMPSPVSGLPADTTFVGDVHYGADDEQVIDVFLPASDTPTPAVLYIHGGGFVAGSRVDVYGAGAGVVRDLVEAHIAWIGVDYRLLEETGIETEGVRKSLFDARRALQFIRFHAEELNVDPSRIGITGGSAGAGTALWLQFHDEMADASSADPIARESTRPQVVAVVATQGTYDVLRWAPDIYHGDYPYVTNDLLLTVPAARELLLRFYGLPADLRDDTDRLLETLESPYYYDYRAELDMFMHCSSDDGPTYVDQPGDAVGPLESGFDVLHHPLHARTLQEICAAAGHEVFADIPAYDISTPGDATSFLIDRL